MSNKLTPEQAKAVVDSWIEEIVANLEPHQRVLPEHAREAIIVAALDRRMHEAFEKGGPDKEVVALNYASCL
jgi:hypothetical protein